MPSGPKERKKGGKMLVMGKAPYPVDHNDLLMDTEVSGSQEIRDDLRRLVRGYLDDGLSLLELDYQPNKWCASINVGKINWKYSTQPRKTAPSDNLCDCQHHQGSQLRIPSRSLRHRLAVDRRPTYLRSHVWIHVCDFRPTTKPRAPTLEFYFVS